MAGSSGILTVTLSKPASPEALLTFRAEVSRELEAGRRAFLVDIDGLGTLDSPTIAALISALRDARERAAVLSLQVSRRPLLETLRITALDQVFTIVVPLAGAAATVAPKVRRPRVPRRIVASVAILTLLGFGGGRAIARTEPAPVDVVRNVVAESARVRSYQATIAVNVHLRSFPYLSEHLDGTTYFKAPDRYEVVFSHVPAIAKGFDRLYTDIDDPTSWERRFDLSLVGERTVGGHRDIVLRLVQKVRGMIDHEDVAIDPETWHIDAMEWHYYTGGAISMSQAFATVDGYSVVAAQHATIRIPYVHAAADATFTNYRTNVSIDDAVFTEASR